MAKGCGGRHGDFVAKGECRLSRNKDARQRRILIELEQRPTLRVSALAQSLAVSTETIRRDLDSLTTRGLIARTYGGAVRRLSTEPPVTERHAQQAPQREAIARVAAQMLSGSGHLLIGSGATTVHVARRLAMETRAFTVVTHAFGVATVLSLNPAIEVQMCPGRYVAAEGAMNGAATLAHLERLRADWAVLGASGLLPEGPADASLEAGEVYAAMTRRAARRMVVADSTKFGRAFPACWAGWEGIDVLVTDAPPPKALKAALAAARVELRVAPS
jgi:DeoR/GlpR family transcriptional regulator of sugar metabolism